MNITTKYNIGDLVKVITETNKELILTIDKIKITVDINNNITVEYNSDRYTKETYNEAYDIYQEPVSILESKEATNDCPISYIKCKVSILELN